MGKCSIKESFVRIQNGEVYIYGMNISPYEKGNIFNKDPLRIRKLLLHRSEINKMEAKLKELETEKTISTYKASYLAMQGFDEKLAEETAKALAEGDMKTVFANQQKANAAYEKKLRADLVKQDPKPDGAGGKNEEKDEAVEFAKKLGKQRADALKNANEGLKHYF